MTRMAADAEVLLHSDDLIEEEKFPFYRVLLLALSFAPLAPVSGSPSYCGWCSENGALPLAVRCYPEIGPRHPGCFIMEFVLTGDAQRELGRVWDGDISGTRGG